MLEQEPLTEDLFQNPPAKYRGAPFWAWNCDVSGDLIREQIPFFKEMGFGGFHIHSRTGMNTEYLSDEFMELVSTCLDTAKDQGLLCWLYDEDRYASGYGGGYVTRDLRFQERYLVFSPRKPGPDIAPDAETFYRNCGIKEGKSERTYRGYFLASYEISLRGGYLDGSVCRKGDLLPEADHVWYAWLEWSEKSSWWNNETYVDTLRKEAVDAFIRITHERYYECFGKEFGKIIPAIFTDEPQFRKVGHLDFPEERKRLIFPCTDSFPESFREAYGEDFLACVPQLVWELPEGQYSVSRYHYYNHLTDVFVGAYAKNIGDWCEAHGIALAGHMKGEETLRSQTEYVGECMRSLRYFQLPGHDVLCDQRDYATAKQAQSVARQYGRYGAISELYGVTNWDFPFSGHKLQGDWQAALGIAVRVPHLTWMSMQGEAKRDYPASIGYQSPWYRQYAWLENHFARVNTAMTRGKPVVRVAVIHPIESFWLCVGVNSQTYRQCGRLEQNYRNIVNWLLLGQIDFDFVSEALLEEPGETGPGLRMGEMAYDTVIVPGCVTLRSNTVQRLECFRKEGGHLLFLGEIPSLVDALPSGQVSRLAGEAVCIPFEKEALLESLEAVREVEILDKTGSRCGNLFYQLREIRDRRYLFLARAYEKTEHGFWEMVNSTDYPYTEKIHIMVSGNYRVNVMDTFSGAISPVKTAFANGRTAMDWVLSVHGSLLLELTPVCGYGAPEGDARTESGVPVEDQPAAGFAVPMVPFGVTIGRLPQPETVIFEEDNVLLLDLAEHRLGDGCWESEEEILKIDNLYRRKLGLPLKEEAGAQPWTYKGIRTPDPAEKQTLYLRFRIRSEISSDACLALETPEQTEIWVNGRKLSEKADVGFFTDWSIRKLQIPGLIPGENEIVLGIPYGRSANIEPCYLLGDFGVEVRGRTKKIVRKAEKIVWGDLAGQGYPFYGGNVLYRCGFDPPDEEFEIKIPYFTNPLLEVSLDGEKPEIIALAPYTARFRKPSGNGPHRLEIRAYGNRYPSFGQLHNADKAYNWVGSCAWRTVGDRFTYEYQIKPSGILNAPMLKGRDRE